MGDGMARDATGCDGRCGPAARRDGLRWGDAMGRGDAAMARDGAMRGWARWGEGEVGARWSGKRRMGGGVPATGAGDELPSTSSATSSLGRADKVRGSRPRFRDLSELRASESFSLDLHSARVGSELGL